MGNSGDARNVSLVCWSFGSVLSGIHSWGPAEEGEEEKRAKGDDDSQETGTVS